MFSSFFYAQLTQKLSSTQVNAKIRAQSLLTDDEEEEMYYDEDSTSSFVWAAAADDSD